MGIETIALVGAGLSAATTVIGTGASIAAAQAEGSAAANSARYRAAVAANEAALARANQRAALRDAERAEEDASRVGFAGQRQVEQQDREARQQIAEVIAAQAASGLRGASQGAVRRSLRALAAQDRFNLREAADAQTADARSRVLEFQAEAINQENRAKGLDSQAQVARAEGRFARSNARLAAWGAGIEGIGRLGNTMVTSATNPILQNFLARRGRRRDVAFPPLWQP